MIIRPDWLQPNDKIGILAPARKIAQEEIQSTIRLFEENDFQVVMSFNLFREYHQFSGTDQERTADLQSFLDAVEIKAIICARGGYGTVRLIDRLDFTLFQQYPKWICGYSDITVLHSHIFQNLKIPTIHSVMPINIKENYKDDRNCFTLLQALRGENLIYHIEKHSLNRNGEAKGKLVGGNLSILYSLLGSDSDVDTKDCILFIEDLEEYLYHVDRMMVNMKRNGKLQNIKALLVGCMNRMNDNAIPFGKTAEEIIAEHCADYDFPLCFNVPSGHGKYNYALRLGMKVHINITNDLSIIKQEI